MASEEDSAVDHLDDFEAIVAPIVRAASTPQPRSQAALKRTQPIVFPNCSDSPRRTPPNLAN